MDDQQLATSETVSTPVDHGPQIGDIWCEVSWPGTLHKGEHKFVILEKLKHDGYCAIYKAYKINWLEKRNNPYWYKSCEGHITYNVGSNELEEKVGTVTPGILSYLRGRHH